MIHLIPAIINDDPKGKPPATHPAIPCVIRAPVRRYLFPIIPYVVTMIDPFTMA